MVAYGRPSLQWAARISHGERNAQVQSIHTVGELPKVRGSPAPNFRLTRGDLSDISLADFEVTVKNPQYRAPLDTGVAAASRAASIKGARATSALFKAEQLYMAKLLRCCESTPEERSAANPHATFCGSRRDRLRRPGGCRVTGIATATRMKQALLASIGHA